MLQQDKNVVSLVTTGVNTPVSTPTVPADSHLLVLTAQGDRQAFEQFYDRHERRIYNKALGKCRDADLAAQLVQDVFVKFYVLVIDSHEPGKYQVSYLYSMLETAYIDYLRAYQVKADVSLDDEESGDFDIADEHCISRPDQLEEQSDIIKLIMQPLVSAEKRLNQAKGAAEKKFALHIKQKTAEDIRLALETFDQLYRYGYTIQEMATNLGLTREQVKYRHEKLLETVKAGLGEMRTPS